MGLARWSPWGRNGTIKQESHIKRTERKKKKKGQKKGERSEKGEKQRGVPAENVVDS